MFPASPRTRILCYRFVFYRLLSISSRIRVLCSRFCAPPASYSFIKDWGHMLSILCSTCFSSRARVVCSRYLAPHASHCIIKDWGHMLSILCPSCFSLYHLAPVHHLFFTVSFRTRVLCSRSCALPASHCIIKDWDHRLSILCSSCFSLYHLEPGSYALDHVLHRLLTISPRTRSYARDPVLHLCSHCIIKN